MMVVGVGGRGGPDNVWVHEGLIKGEITLDDDSEVEIFDVGTLSSSIGEKIDSGYFDLDINSQTNVDIRLYVDIDGSLVQVGEDQGFSNDESFDMSDFEIQTPVVSSRVRVTAQGDKANPNEPGTLKFTIEHSTAL